MATAAAALDAASRTLAAAGVENARREARLLLAHTLGVGPAALIAEPARRLDPEVEARFAALVARRARREPFSHLVGVREFWSLDFAVNSDVLDPRPDSETLVQTALDLFPDGDAPLDVLDLGTGSGCLLLSLLAERKGARGLGIDISAPALRVAAVNAVRLGLAARATFRKGDWGDGLDATFDLILCNPPYIARGAIDSLEPEVARFDPLAALDGGVDGYDAYRALAPHLARLLSPRGVAVIEAGDGQATEINRIFRISGLPVADVRRDLAGRERCIVLRVH
jgi:release factor glutamine methyltransferase